MDWTYDLVTNTFLASLRIANFYQAAATSSTVLEYDTRPEELRLCQIGQHIARSRVLDTLAMLEVKELGK
jgi:hypothetical protein